jgi:hypothetical protein
MDTWTLHYRTAAKGIPPRPIRLEVPGWAGDAAKPVDGSVAQPWHCNPFVEGSTYGLELIYPFDTECQVINRDGVTQIEWDFAREGGGVTGGEFVVFAPGYYLFNTMLSRNA